ncbi:OLC1v1020792C1 [Oldenlandia corymbosa var. corymbosa]|uniref:OLC1v1020792C1 n=1 Tax=Oldenlandia corymbosa var. corymbosa TaxID=529605 RepID=A0AAV1BUU0_OLDCO|nr:OLC1v1020792C1 [Oldenlandia corymbosa var. corymbosa]
MSGRTGSHQLSNGLYVSGRPEQHQKERQPTMASRAVPYTGGDVKRSGELGKMYGIETSSSSVGGGDHHLHVGPPPIKTSSRHSSSSQHNSGSIRSGPNSGQLGPKPGSSSVPAHPKRYNSSSSSGPMTPIQPTGLITSGPLGSSRSGRGAANSDHQPPVPTSKPSYGSAVTVLGDDAKYGFRVSKVALWLFLIVVMMGLLVGAFLMVAVKKAVVLVAVAGVLAPAILGLFWNFAFKKRGLQGYLRRYPDAELRGAEDGQFVKVTGVVTCGSVPLESSFQRVPRCVYTATELYEYRGWGGKSANPRHRYLSWGCRTSEKYVADFYISDFQSGLRALVKAGYNHKVTPFVKSTTVVDITKDNKDLSPNFLRWLADRSLSTDDRTMRLKESYIKEGSTVSVMGMVSRQDNVLMIVPPREPISTGCQWINCLLPMYIEGLVVSCDESPNDDVIPV